MNRIALILAATLVAALAAAPAAIAGPGLNSSERDVIRRLNQVRAGYGLPALRASSGLNRAADRHSADMLRSDFFDHVSSDGTSFDTRIRRFTSHAGVVGETIATVPARRGGADAIVGLWMNSPPHRAIVLDGRFRRVGLARRWGSLGSNLSAVVTADFASPG